MRDAPNPATLGAMESYDVEERIAQLEHELADLRATRPKAERPRGLPSTPRRRAWTTMIALSLFATSLPVATWLHLGATEEAARIARKSEQHHERRLQLAAYRQERTMRFVDAALDEHRPEADREAALRFLANELGDKSAVRRWASKELKRDDGAPAKRDEPSPCGRRSRQHP